MSKIKIEIFGVGRGMDIAWTQYRGMPVNYMSKTGIVSPAYYESEGMNWLHNFFAGTLTTCGLLNVGGPEKMEHPVIGERIYGLHGRISNSGAEQVALFEGWENGKYVMKVSGMVQEGILHGEHLTLRREISTELGSKEFRIKDVVTNHAAVAQDIMLLYHINVGYPILDCGSRMIAASKEIIGQSEEAEREIDQATVCSEPILGLAERCYAHDLYTDAGTPYEWQTRIKDECDLNGIDFLSTPFDNDAVDFLEQIGCEAYKIASFELVDIPLIEYTASKGKPMIISCGMSTAEEIQDAVNACRRVGNEQIILLKCCSEYPANWEDMHIANIPDMISRFGVKVGLSDHSEGSIADVVAVSMGACVIEKHVKLEGVDSADSEFSMPMNEFAEMVKAVRAAKTIAGKIHYGPTEKEKDNLKFRRSLFAVEDINAGDVVTEENVRSIRPSNGLLPKYNKEILGKKAVCDIKRGTPLTMEMFE